MTFDDPALFESVIDRTMAYAKAHLAQRNTAPVCAPANAEILRQRLYRPLPENGLPPCQVLDELVRDAADGLHHMNNGRFYGWVNGGVLPAALGAELMAVAWDQNAALYTVAPAASIVEEIVGDWFRQIFALPNGSSFALVTGTQLAHVTCLAAARHRLLAKCSWDVEAKGLNGAPRVVVLTSSEHHGSIHRAVRLLGIGADNIVALPTDDRGQLPPETLSKALAVHANDAVIVSLQAGDLKIGAFDDFAQLVPIAHAAGAWVHVDGAFGLWAAASPTHAAKTVAMNTADSWSTDGHKWLNTPYDCGVAMVADAHAHAAALTYSADYLLLAGDTRNAMDWGPEWSRRARGFALYAALRELGQNGVAEMIDRTCAMAARLVDGIGALNGAIVEWRPTLNQGLVRFPSPYSGASAEEDDARNDAVIAAVNATGEALFSGTTWRGRRCMRVSVCGWQTSEADIDRAVAAVGRVLQQP